MRRKLRISCVRARMCVRRTIDHGDDPAPALDGLQQKIRNSFREALVPNDPAAAGNPGDRH